MNGAMSAITKRVTFSWTYSRTFSSPGIFSTIALTALTTASLQDVRCALEELENVLEHKNGVYLLHGLLGIKLQTRNSWCRPALYSSWWAGKRSTTTLYTAVILCLSV